MRTRETTPLNRTRWAAIGAAIAITLGGGGLIGVSASGTESTFIPVEPGRILDTRSTTPIGADNAYGTPLRLKVAGADLTDGSRSAGIPTTATAVSGTITATGTGGWGFVTAYPCDSTNDTPPGASNVNYTGADQTVANSATIPLSTDGYICLTAYDTTHILFDVSGYYTPANTNNIDAYTKTETNDLLDNKADQDALDAVFESPAFREALLDQAGGLDLEFDLLGDTSLLMIPDIAVNSAGNPVMIAGYVPPGGNLLQTRLQMITCTNRTCSGDTTPIPITEEGTAYGAIALTSDDRPVVAYVSADGVKILRCGNTSCSSGNSTVSPTAGGGLQSLAVDSNDLPVVASVDVNDNVYVITCATADCSSTKEELVGTNGGELVSVGVGPNDYPIVAYIDRVAEKANLVLCNDPTCGSTTLREIASSIDIGGGIDLAITSDGRAGVAYVDGNGIVTIEICTTTTCSTTDTSEFGMLKTRGATPSLEFDSDDLGVLAVRAEYPNYKIADADSDSNIQIDEVGQTETAASTFFMEVHRCLTDDCQSMTGDSRPAPRIAYVGGLVRAAIADDDTFFVAYPSFGIAPGLTISTK